MINQTFGQYLRKAREAKGVSLRKFAEKVGKTPTYISKIERDELDTKPSEELVEKIAKELGADFDELIILAGRIPSELPDIINQRPHEMTALLRTASKMKPKELAELLDSLKGKDGK
jgi:transcriptional regulator with XRE-family HTH domain